MGMIRLMSRVPFQGILPDFHKIPSTFLKRDPVWSNRTDHFGIQVWMIIYYRR
jgi:hypothetical protein